MLQFLVAAISGILFGLGLFISQMTDPTKVLSFLDLTRIGKGTWDPSLIFVMAAGFAVMACAHFIRQRRENKLQPSLLGADFALPKDKAISRNLVIGSAVFGVGWGLAGYCPGPALASLAFLPSSSFVFLIGLTLGSLAAGLYLRSGNQA